MSVPTSVRRHALAPIAFALALAFGAVAPAAAADKIVVTKQADLPRFSYRLGMPASRFVDADDATFKVFAAQVLHDVDRVLADYRISDHSMLTELLSAKLGAQELLGDTAGGLQTVEALREQADKPAAKLLTGLVARARLQAAQESAGDAAAYEAAFRQHYQAAIDPLPWAVVRDSVKASYASSLTASRAAILADVATELDPAIKKSGALDAEQAWGLIDARVALKKVLMLMPARADVLHAYIAKNDAPKPDIWAAREATLNEADRLTPVNVAIWDSGIDVSLFPQQLFDDPHPTASGAHGLAFDDLGRPSKDWLYPLTPEQRAKYPVFQQMIRGRLDLQNGVDSADAKAVRQMFQTMSPEAMHELFEADKVLGFYVHGTHCAGIAVRGNPAARLVVARFDDQLPDLPFRPTVAWVQRMGADFRQMADYFRTRHVRVVNMSWGDEEPEFEMWLAKTGGGANAKARQREAQKLFALWKQGIEQALRAAPDTLFVTAAGNSDSNVGFTESVPAALKLPNLISVGAVNQAGDETSFTSHGDAVLVHASGYQVDSFVPGGQRLPLSGTSMAAPNVVNLAAKLFALDPSLKPAQVIDLIRRGATTTEDGRRHLIDEKRSVELLKTERLAKQG